MIRTSAENILIAVQWQLVLSAHGLAVVTEDTPPCERWTRLLLSVRDHQQRSIEGYFKIHFDLICSTLVN